MRAPLHHDSIMMLRHSDWLPKSHLSTRRRAAAGLVALTVGTILRGRSVRTQSRSSAKEECSE